MVNVNYRKGYSLEYRTRKLLEKLGFFVVRPAMSKGPADLVAFDKTAKLLIQCKRTAEDRNIYGLDLLLELARRHDAKPLLVYSFPNSPIYVQELFLIGKAKLKKEEMPHKELEKYLAVDLKNFDEESDENYFAR